MTQKNLIHDILNELATNPESRERLNNTNEDYHIVAHSLFNFFNELTCYEQKHFILSALSSPNGVPICDFLAGDNPEWTERNITTNKYSGKMLSFEATPAEFLESANNGLIHAISAQLLQATPKTISATLYYTLCNCIEQGMNFSKIEKVLNLKYNELLCP